MNFSACFFTLSVVPSSFAFVKRLSSFSEEKTAADSSNELADFSNCS
jgi:hypothetical protein